VAQASAAAHCGVGQPAEVWRQYEGVQIAVSCKKCSKVINVGYTLSVLATQLFRRVVWGEMIVDGSTISDFPCEYATGQSKNDGQKELSDSQ
jgi:hypothetical protein